MRNCARNTEPNSGPIKLPILQFSNQSIDCDELIDSDSINNAYSSIGLPHSILQSTSKTNVKHELATKFVSFSPVELAHEYELYSQPENDLSSTEEEMEDELLSSQGSQLIKITTILHQGVLLRQRTQLSRSQWKSEWFVLRCNKLSCYKDEKVFQFLR